MGTPGGSQEYLRQKFIFKFIEAHFLNKNEVRKDPENFSVFTILAYNY